MELLFRYRGLGFRARVFRIKAFATNSGRHSGFLTARAHQGKGCYKFLGSYDFRGVWDDSIV